MHNKILYLLTMIIPFLGSCEGRKPTINEITGVWKSSDGGILNLNKDGSFSGKNLPVEVFFYPGEEKGINEKFSCTGTWTIQGNSSAWDQLPWQLQLNINTTNPNNPDYFAELPVLISGSGLMENAPPWDYLFLWKGEPGSDRYKFFKKKE